MSGSEFFRHAILKEAAMQGRVLLLVTILAVSPTTAFAGFEMKDNGQSIDISNMPSTPGKVVTYTPPRPIGAPPETMETIKKTTRPESDPSAPALQIFNERYLPDTVKKKYNIKDSWYEQPASQPDAAAPPQSLESSDTTVMPSASPKVMAEPLVVDDGPQQEQSPVAEKPVQSEPEQAPRMQTLGDPSQSYYKSVSLKDLGIVSQNPDATATDVPTESASKTVGEPQPEVRAEVKAEAKVEELPAEKIAALPTPSAKMEPAPLTAAAPSSYAKVESWRARKGEPVREVLKRWSQREGTELMWASGDAPNLPKDFSFVGPLDKAVAALIKSTGVPLYTQYRSDGLTPVMMSPASTVTTDMPPEPAQEPAVTIDAAIAPAAAAPIAPALGVPQRAETRWFALSGASLPEVLQVWADDEGATLVWQASSSYALKDSVSQVGHFEDAVFKALSQFNNDETRPVGQLYADPATGKKVLLIRNDTPS